VIDDAILAGVYSLDTVLMYVSSARLYPPVTYYYYYHLLFYLRRQSILTKAFIRYIRVETYGYFAPPHSLTRSFLCIALFDESNYRQYHSFIHNL
jgi:hypothetical protein